MRTTHYVMQLHIGTTWHNAHNLTLHKALKFQILTNIKVANSKIKLEYNGNAKQVQR
jgi:hypothetical protein